MKLFLIVLAFPAIFLFLLSSAMVRSAQQKYARREIERRPYLNQLGLAAVSWGVLVLMGGTFMTGFGLASKSPLFVAVIAAIVSGVIFARLSRGVLWGKS